jgi:uncharacterized protein (DUF488 family)
MALSTLWTIGYEKAGQGALIAALKGAKIKLVLDVREVANSRRAGFAKKSLTAGLDAAGIAYVHMKSLGTPKAGRDAARRGDVKTMHAIMAAKLDGPESQMALAEAAELAGKQRTCLLCLEHDWRVCHRALVAQELEAFGFKAEHLEPESAD